jgi:sugar phosphate isomerase/epimerase
MTEKELEALLKVIKESRSDKPTSLIEQSTTDGKELSADTVIQRLIECATRYKEGQIYLSGLNEDIKYYITEYASQKDAQIQALSKEVEGLKDMDATSIKMMSGLLKTNNELVETGDKMVEVLQRYTPEDAREVLEIWEKLNK